MPRQAVGSSTLRRIVVQLAQIGLDVRRPVNRIRNFLLRPVRLEIAEAHYATVAALAAQQDEITAIRAELEAARHNIDQNSVDRQNDNLAWTKVLKDHQGTMAGALEDVVARHGDLAASLRGVEQHLARTVGTIREDLAAAAHDAATHIRTERAQREQRVLRLERLVSSGPYSAEPPADDQPQISVVMPTHDRGDVVGDAIRSVQAQVFSAWELIIVDDGSTDHTQSVLAAFGGDPRVRVVSQPHRGAAAARNTALRHARAPLIAYLDSDNLYYPGFLHEAVQALRTDRSIDIVYGVLATDEHDLGDSCLLQLDFDRKHLLLRNFIDLNTVVHRSDLTEQYGGFDESIDRLQDWDLLLRLTTDRPARPLPTLAARYRVCDDRRITVTVPEGPSSLSIRRKWYPQQGSPVRPRVLYAVWHYPQLSESYVETELRCVRRWGADVAVWRTVVPASPYPCDVPIHDGTLAEAVEAFRPDVVHVHWLSFALARGDLLQSLGVRVTIRLHGFDVTKEGLDALLAQPWVSAVYAFPAQMSLITASSARSKPVPVAFDSTLFAPQPRKDRHLVVRTGAALPSKDIPLFFDLSRRLPDHRFVFAGVTCNQVEAYVETLRDLRSAMNAPVELMWDVPREAVAALVAEAGFYVHTINPPGTKSAAPIGMPVSIAEAMATGALALVRNLPELAAYVGDAGLVYGDVDDAARIIADATRWSENRWSKAWIGAVDRAFLNHADEIVLRPIFDDWSAIAAERAAAIL